MTYAGIVARFIQQWRLWHIDGAMDLQGNLVDRRQVDGHWNMLDHPSMEAVY